MTTRESPVVLEAGPPACLGPARAVFEDPGEQEEQIARVASWDSATPGPVCANLVLAAWLSGLTRPGSRRLIWTNMSDELPELTPAERDAYEWQMWLPGFGEMAQRRLKGSSVLISRVGGLGGLVAYQLAAAGVGKLVLAHGGVLLPSDLNRQLLQTHDRIGLPRIESIVTRLRQLNPHIEIVGVGENVSELNSLELVSQVDLVVDAAPLFQERFALNRAAVALDRPMIECAMYAFEAHITTFLPGSTGCLACLCPESPSAWKRKFPVLGAVSGTVACLGAVEAVKVLTGLGVPLAGTLLAMDLSTMEFRRLKVQRDPECSVCSSRESARPGLRGGAESVGGQ